MASNRSSSEKQGKDCCELFDMVQSVDSLELAVLIDKCAAETGKKQSILIQVKLSDEDNKHGIIKENLNEALGGIRQLGNSEG